VNGSDHLGGRFFETVSIAPGGDTTEIHAPDEGAAEVLGRPVRLPVAQRSQNAYSRSHKSRKMANYRVFMIACQTENTFL
jgi:hypothetical protein